MLQRIATKAIIEHEGKILLLREAATYGDGTQRGRWHVPGGRVELGEHFEAALRREVQEEAGLEIEIVRPILVGEWRPTIKGEPNQIVGIFFLCRTTAHEVTLSTEHDGYQWVSPFEIANIDIMDPDDVAITASTKEEPWTKN